MGCLDDNEVVDFMEGRLDASRREAVEAHLADCATCRRVLARTAEALLPTGSDDASQEPFLAPLRGLLPGDRVGRYRVLHRVGAGGMGVVYAAEDTELRRNVALKLLRADPSQPAGVLGARLKREARAASLIQHPNVVPVHDVLALEDGSPVLVMDLLVGESLRVKLDREAPLSVAKTAEILLPVLSGLQAAHALGVVHRDLKPENIFLSVTATGERDVKIVDFGVAKLTALDGPAAQSAGMTDTGALVGTPYYMSPEQAFGEKNVDARADLWAVGVILYECLAAKRPTEADNVGQVLKALAHLSFPALETVAPSVPPGLAALVAGLLKERSLRIPTAEEAKKRLAEAVSSHEQPLPPRTARWPRWLALGLPLTLATAGLLWGVGFPSTTESPAAPSADSASSPTVPVVDSTPMPSFAPIPTPPSASAARPVSPARSAPAPRTHANASVTPVPSAVPPATQDPTKLMIQPPF
jgi:serine/threonine-protein kinase